MLNELNIKILQSLMEAKEPISSKDLAVHCDVAVNTLRKEIGLLNEIIEPHGFHILSKTATGHYIEILDDEMATPYMEKLKYLFERNRRMGNRNSARISYLTRRCLCANDNLTVEKLCQELYCSRSTLLRDLDKVKQELKHFDLTLKNRRGGGLGVEGSEWNLRQCLIYQHKVHKVSIEEAEYREDAFKTMFFMENEEKIYWTIRRIFVDALMEQHDFSLPFMCYPKIVHFIQLSASRQKYRSRIQFTQEQIQRVSNTAEYEFVKKLSTKLPDRFREALKEKEQLGLAMMILSYEDQNGHLESQAEYSPYYQETMEMIDSLVNQWGYGRELFDETFVDDWICFLYALENRQIFHVFQDIEALGLIQYKGIRTADFCLCFGRFYKRKHGVSLSREECLSAFYLFKRVLREDTYCFYAPDILVVSQYGMIFAKDIARKIKCEYGKEVNSVEAKEYRLDDKEASEKYDILITDLGAERIRQLEHYHLPVLPVTYRLEQDRFLELDAYLDVIQQESELSILTEECFRDTSLKSKEEVFGYLAKLYQDYGVDPQLFMNHLKENDEQIDLEKRNEIVFLPVFLDQIKETRIQVLINDTPFLWNHNLAQIFVCYTRTASLRENQILNQILSKFVHISTEAAKHIISHKEGSPILQIYPES
jgi:hypothetical protein